ncbi:MAG: TonB family protein [Hyphomonadaceae bacterium]|nr:TonB family protein [Hyphomonadaceae bacterium]
MAVRTMSLSLSAVALALVAAGALSLRFPAAIFAAPDAPPIPIVTIAEPEPPAPVYSRTPPQPLEPGAVFDSALTPALPLDQTVSETAIQTSSFDAGPTLITSPHWLARPGNLARYYPRRALLRGIEGEVTLDCRVSREGLLDCAVISETPADWEFAAAARRIAHEHRMQPAMRDGVAVEGRYRMRVPFTLD